jgi:hypothetical protein
MAENGQVLYFVLDYIGEGWNLFNLDQQMFVYIRPDANYCIIIMKQLNKNFKQLHIHYTSFYVNYLTFSLNFKHDHCLNLQIISPSVSVHGNTVLFCSFIVQNTDSK